MKNTVAAFTLALLVTTFAMGLALAQSDSSCADLLKMNAQLDAATKEAMAKDPSAAAIDKKINDYCTKNPNAKASEAMEKALSN